MNSFTIIGTGNLATDPQPGSKGDKTFTRFGLIGNDYAGRDSSTGESREVTTTMWFTAFGAKGAAIAKHCRVGDQLVVFARVRNNEWTDKHGEKRHDHSYQVEDFKFGQRGRASRAEWTDTASQSEGRAPSDALDEDVPF